MSIMHDNAVALSDQYFDAIELRFRISRLDNGDAMVFPDSLTPSAVRALARDLADVLTGTMAARALDATTAFGASRVQSVAFGTLEDFPTAVKVGRLYSERIVFWDILGLECGRVAKVAAENQWVVLPDDLADGLASIASNVLGVRALASDGAAVVLPHPLAWSRAASDATTRASRGWDGPFFGTRFGTLMAATLAVSQQLKLHPYSLETIPVALPAVGELALALSRENQLLQQTFGEVVADERFSYLRKVSVTQFHHLIRSHEDVAEELQTLVGDLGGKTEQQWRRRLEYVRRSLSDAVARQNDRLAKQILESGARVSGLASEFSAVKGVFALLGAAADAGARTIAEPVLGAPSVVAFFTHTKWVAENTSVVQPTG